MKPKYIFILLTITYSFTNAQTKLANGEQPRITVDAKGIIRLVYGEKDNIFLSTSSDNGKTFSTPQLVAQVSEMHLGMTRGPQLATSADYSIVTAMDKKGNIHAFKQNHKSGKWAKIGNVNDFDGSAPEGLMSIAADENNNFYAVWLDLRQDRQNNICFASLKDSKWTTNTFAYKSAESHVCECCKPSIAADGKTITIMFRNWLMGSRDLYLITSSNNGATFSKAQKLGNGTWPLKGCPMDGGGLFIDSHNQIHTAWQRDGSVFYSLPGKPEQKVGEGRHVGLSGSIITWESGSDLILKKPDHAQEKIGDGTSLEIQELKDKSILAVWEKDDQIVFKKI
ncbi:MAG TPA: hypothetical protein VK589_27610 [Chryseolinea sp.]|nr:hypothetical protein [Chryseolinea sp.]